MWCPAQPPASEKSPHQQECPHRVWSLNLRLLSLQHCELNKPLSFVTFPVCGIQLQQQKTDQEPPCFNLQDFYPCYSFWLFHPLPKHNTAVHPGPSPDDIFSLQGDWRLPPWTLWTCVQSFKSIFILISFTTSSIKLPYHSAFPQHTHTVAGFKERARKVSRTFTE
jgi:hypothetical protein